MTVPTRPFFTSSSPSGGSIYHTVKASRPVRPLPRSYPAGSGHSFDGWNLRRRLNAVECATRHTDFRRRRERADVNKKTLEPSSERSSISEPAAMINHRPNSIDWSPASPADNDRSREIPEGRNSSGITYRRGRLR